MDAGATFRSPATDDDELTVAARTEDWHDKRFRLGYRLSVGDRLVAEGFELRIWALIENGRLNGAPIAPAFRAAIEGSGRT